MLRKHLSFTQHLRAREVNAGVTRCVQMWDLHMRVPVSLALDMLLATAWAAGLCLSDIPRSLELAGSPARPGARGVQFRHVGAPTHFVEVSSSYCHTSMSSLRPWIWKIDMEHCMDTLKDCSSGSTTHNVVALGELIKMQSFLYAYGRANTQICWEMEAQLMCDSIRTESTAKRL